MEAETPNPPTTAFDLTEPVVEAGSTWSKTALEHGAEQWFDAYVQSRIIEVGIAEQDVVNYGPWHAEADFGTDDASEDGEITLWNHDYYITHDWSEYGKQILAMVPGDTVVINDHMLVVDRIFNYPKESYYDEIMAITGYDGSVLQTCYPDSDQNRIVWCHEM